MVVFIRFILPAFIGLLLIPYQAAAGFEFSGGGSFNKSNYGDGNYSWSRRWGASLGYYLTERTELEVGFQDVVDRTVISGYEDTTFHDQIYSANVVISVTGKNAPIQPYFKVGIGQLNRTASGTYAFGAPAAVLDQVTGILGAGLRLYLTRAFGIRAEGTSYLSGGSIGTWQDNFALSLGVSVYF